MPRHPKPSHSVWSIVIYHVSDAHRQQQILHRIRFASRVGVTALGTMSGHDAFVVIECGNQSDEVFVRRIIMGFDPGAVKTLRTSSSGLAGPIEVS